MDLFLNHEIEYIKKKYQSDGTTTAVRDITYLFYVKPDLRVIGRHVALSDKPYLCETSLVPNSEYDKWTFS